VVSSTSRPHFTPGKDPVPILLEAGWAPGPIWTGGKSRPHRDSIPDRPSRSQSLYRLSYSAHICVCVCVYIYIYYLLNPWCRVILEKLTGLQLVKKFPAFHGTRRFISAPTSVRYIYIYIYICVCVCVCVRVCARTLAKIGTGCPYLLLLRVNRKNYENCHDGRYIG